MDQASLFLQLIAKAEDQCAFLLDTRGIVCSWNAGVERLLGYSEADFTGQPCSSFCLGGASEDGLEASGHAFEELVERGQVSAMRSYLKSDGSILAVESTTATLHDDGGQLVGFGRILRKAKRPEEHQDGQDPAIRNVHARLSASLNSKLLGIWTWDLQRDELIADEHLETIFGLTPNGGLPRSHKEYLDRIHPDDVVDVQSKLDVAISEISTFRTEFRVCHTDSTYHWVESQGQITSDPAGRALSLNGVVIDISDRKNVEQALIESEAQYGASFDHAPIGICLATPQGQITRSNAVFRELVGYEAQELEGNDSTHITHPEDVELTRSLIAMLRAGTAPTATIEKRYLRKNGAERWARATVTLRRDKAGEPVQIIGILEDITERRQVEKTLREAQEKFEAAFLHAPIGMVLTTPEGMVVETNRAYRELVGFDAGELQNKSFLDITFPEDIPGNQKLFGRLLAGEIPSYTLEKRLVSKEGRVFWVRATATVQRDSNGHPRELIGLVENIEERKAIEAERERLLRDLERSNEELSRFAHIAAHDLQSPLRMVKSYTQLLSRRLKDSLNTDTTEFMAIVIEGADRMEKLIQALLNYAQVGQNEPDRRDVQLTAVVKAAIHNLESVIADSGAQIETESLPVVEGDSVQLLQLFQNLIVNALKYYRPGEPPRIVISLKTREETHWLIAVEDNGQGIPEQYLEQIFEPLKRLHGREVAGTGIGLALARKIVERHGGSIWAESEVGRGSTFFVTLPRK